MGMMFNLFSVQHEREHGYTSRERTHLMRLGAIYVGAMLLILSQAKQTYDFCGWNGEPPAITLARFCDWFGTVLVTFALYRELFSTLLMPQIESEPINPLVEISTGADVETEHSVE